MALLQISEPGMSPVPHEHKLAIGIDLGTTHSLVASVLSGMAQVLCDSEGEPLVPSVVRYLADGSAIVGKEAVKQAATDPHNTFFSIKRFMGRGVQDIAPVYLRHYDVLDAPGMAQLKTVAGVKSPVEISAQILDHLRLQAEAALGGTLVGAVITVPAYFDEAQRQATKDAAKLAQINVLRLLNEPTAAALAYGLDQQAEGVYAVYDLGGGTFDISILRLQKGLFEVLATGGDSALGGDDFDHCLYEWVLHPSTTQIDGTALSKRDSQQLLWQCRLAKEQLSSATEAKIHLVCENQKVIDVQITRQQFTELTQALVDKTLLPVQRALRDAGVSADEIQGVVMVGGATRMLHVRFTLAGQFNHKLLHDLDPDQVVALGAATQANLLAGNRLPGEDWLLLDVIPLSLGVETMGGLVEKIIPRNSTIPLARAQEFTTFKDGQTAMAIHILQGERELASDCRSLARFELHGIPAMPAGAARIRVTYQVDADGLLDVSARELQSGVEASMTVKPSYGLTDDDITHMLQQSMSAAKDDMRVRMLREQQVDAERLLDATRTALINDGELLTPEEKHTIEQAINTLQSSLQQTDEKIIKQEISNLAAATDEFAARRMNKNIRLALTGKTVDQIAENLGGQ